MEKVKLLGLLILAVVAIFGFTPKQTSATVPGINTRVSLDNNGVQANSNSSESSVSADGRYIAFVSQASNLVTGDTNGFHDIFVRDMLTNTTKRVSVSSNGTQSNNNSSEPYISYDGSYVVFGSDATNLVAGDTNTFADVFIHNMTTGTTQIVSTSASGTLGNNISRQPVVSPDGRFVVFVSYALNLVPGVSVTKSQIYIKDLNTLTISILSKDSSNNGGNGDSFYPSISCDGNIIVFASRASNLVSGDTNGAWDIFAITRADNTINNITSNGNGDSTYSRVSCNGNYIAFHSVANNLAAGDTNTKADIFRYDRLNTSMTLVSKSTAGALGNDFSSEPAINADGRFITFSSAATNLITGDTNSNKDVFIRDMLGGNTEIVSKNATSQIGNGLSGVSSITADGTLAAYQSTASNLIAGDTNASQDIFSAVTGVDIIAPVVTGAPDRSANSYGWYNGDVTVTWTSVDPAPSSGTPTQPPSTTANLEGTHTYTSTQSCDPAGNCADGNITLSIDKTNPTITATQTPAANSYGWNNSNVAVNFTCSDALSGISSCSNSVTLSSEGQNQTVTGTAVDNADNSTPTTASVNIDKTIPTVSNIAMTNTFLWSLNRNTTVTADASDILSGIADGELFIDTDPGAGNGTPMAFSAGQLSKTMTISGLNTGNHTLYVRSRDKAGNWSSVISINFLYLP